VLVELRVENLFLIERAELRLAGGLNVLTGETGAGKTVLAHALDLLLGGRARSSPIRPGASEAYVEGAFELTDGLRRRVGERLPDDAEELVLARRVASDGRTRAYLNGRSIGVGELRELAGGLLTFYGQHEHRRLALASTQLDVLDGFRGGDQAERRAAYATAYSRRREAAAQLRALRDAAGSRDRELDLIQFELAEIEQAAPQPGEDEGLRGERDRLRAAEGLRSAARAGAEALAPESGGPGAASLVAEAAARLEGLSGVDAVLDGVAQRLRGLGYEAEDLGRELRRYEDAVESSPSRLEEVEERLALLDRLKRKHGGTIDAVLAHADRCRLRLDELAVAEVALEEATARLQGLEGELSEHGRRLSAARREAAGDLAAAMRERLAELAMPEAGFEVGLAPHEEAGPAGAETVEFLIAPNPGVPPGPVREIASGGELSRIMLALMGLAAEADGRRPDDAPPLLVFDEVDAGIGGHTARAVGVRLRALAASHQVLCITHLPQVASLADRHFRIVKDVSGPAARAAVDELGAGEVEGELVRMLGAAADDDAARRHARQLLRAA
jgi:DNA repair protein RecN (Recombination protein N)